MCLQSEKEGCRFRSVLLSILLPHAPGLPHALAQTTVHASAQTTAHVYAPAPACPPAPPCSCPVHAPDPCLSVWNMKWNGVLPPRYWLVLFCTTANLICYVDRINLSLTIVPMADKFGWPHHIQGYVLAAFFYGYVMTQILGGYLSQRYGGTCVLISAVVGWSIMTLLTPMAATFLPCLYACRWLMGVFEGVSLPAIHHIASTCFLEGERSRCIALVTSGQNIGTLISLLSAPMMARDWQAIYYSFGIVGLVWALAFGIFLWLQADRPSDDGSGWMPVSLPEKEPRSTRKVMLQLLTSRAAWAVYAAHFGHNWGWYMLLTWMPKYLTTLGIRLEGIGWYAAVPYIGCWVGANLSGWCADRMYARDVSLGLIRKLNQSICMLGAAGSFLVIIGYRVTAVHEVSALLTVALFLIGFNQAGFWCNILDMAPNNAALLLGISNTLGTLPGIVGNTLTGWILEKTHDWALVFMIATCMEFVCWVWYVSSATSRPLY